MNIKKYFQLVNTRKNHDQHKQKELQHWILKKNQELYNQNRAKELLTEGTAYEYAQLILEAESLHKNQDYGSHSPVPGLAGHLGISKKDTALAKAYEETLEMEKLRAAHGERPHPFWEVASIAQAKRYLDHKDPSPSAVHIKPEYIRELADLEVMQEFEKGRTPDFGEPEYER